MSGRKHVNWRTSSSGRAASHLLDVQLNDTDQPSLLDASRLAATALSSKVVGFQYDAHGAAVYVCAVISVYALFVVVFVSILFAVRRRRRPKSRHGAADEGNGQGNYLVNIGRLPDFGVCKAPQQPPPPPPAAARLRSDSSSSSASPVRRSSRRARRRRSISGQSAGTGRRCHVDKLVAPPRRRSTKESESRRAINASPIDDVITLIQVEAATSREGSRMSSVDNVAPGDVAILTPSTGTASTSASTIDVSANRCRWSTGSNGDIWVLQIEPDDASPMVNWSPERSSYLELATDDIGPDRRSTSIHSLTSTPRADQLPLTVPSVLSSSSSSSSSATAVNLLSKSDLIDLSVAHVIKCCRQPPWDQLLPVAAGAAGKQPYADVECDSSSRGTSGNDSWRSVSQSSTAVQSPAELQHLLHVTSV